MVRFFTAALLAPTAGLSEPSPTHHRHLEVEGAIVNPDWINKPSGDDVARVYPKIAGAIGLTGRATVSCTVSLQSTMEKCHIMSELPDGLGFGKAAIALTPFFRIHPATVDGQPVGDAVVNIPISFMVRGDSPPPMPAPRVSAIGPRSLALAHRAAVVFGGLTWSPDGAVEALRRAVADDPPVTDHETQVREVAFRAYRDAMAANAAKVADGLARAFAATFSESELDQIAAFLETPGGKAFLAHNRELAAAVRAQYAEAQGPIQADAQTGFCQMVKCLTAEPAPTPSSK